MSTAWFDDQPRAWTGPGDPGMGAASAWDTIVIAGWRFYGRISGRVGTKLDVQDRLGKKGASLGNSKRHPAEVDVELWILTAQDMQHLDALLSYLRNDANAKNASDVHHPSLNLDGVQSLYFEAADLIKPPEGGKPASKRLRFREWLPDSPGPASTIPVASSSSSNPLGVTQQSTGSDPPAACFPPSAPPPSGTISGPTSGN